MPPKSHEQDIMIVHNIDTNCSMVTFEMVEVEHKEIDDEGKVRRWTEKVPDECHHEKGFKVRWGSRGFTIEPGGERKMPRFLAEHYAKHLADHMLLKEQAKTGRMGLMNSKIERPKMLDRIVLGVDTYYFQEDDLSEGDAVFAQVSEINKVTRPEPGELDLGAVLNKAVGTLVDEPDEYVAPDIDSIPDEEEPTAIDPNNKPNIFDPTNLPKRKDMMKALSESKIKFKMTDSKEELAALLRNA